MSEIDLTLALQLQAQFEEELRVSLLKQQEDKKKQKKEDVPLILEFDSKKRTKKPLEEPQQEKLSVSLVDPTWELIDPNPDIHTLFLTYNDQFFWGRLAGIEVRWSPRMTLCAGVCCYEGRGGLCSVRLSLPLLKLRPRKDLVETLLHEMIHAYLFVTANNRDRDGHGPEFHKHMYRINGVAGTNISVFHKFHDEVDVYRQHIWQCNGPCRTRQPYFGLLKRSMNRAPGPKDHWWERHQQTCGGTYIKVQEPERAKTTKKESKTDSKNKADGLSDIRKYMTFTGKGNSLGGVTSKNVKSKDRQEPVGVNKPDFSRELNSVNDTEKKTESGSEYNLNERKEKSNKVRGIGSAVSGEVNKIKVSGASHSNVHGFGTHSPVRKKVRSGSGVTDGKMSEGKETVKKKSTSYGGTGLSVRGSGSRTITVKGKTSTQNENKVKEENNGAALPSSFQGQGYTLGGSTGKVSKLLSLSSPQFCTSSKNSSLISQLKSDSTSEIYSDPKVARRNSSKSKGNTDQKHENSFDCYVETPSSSSSSSSSSCSRETVRCPVCDVSVSFTDINNHVDECVGNLSDEDMLIDNATKETSCIDEVSFDDVSCGDTNMDKDYDRKQSQTGSLACSKSNESDKYPCPVCGDCYSPTTINRHLDAHF